MSVNELLGQEWTTLQNNHEQYERGGLLLKVVAVVLTAAGAGLGFDALLVGGMVALLWVQEGIYRTFQSRIGARILRVEALVRDGGLHAGETPLAGAPDGPAFQLHSEWLATRQGVAGLLAEYARSACRPTVAFPYALIVLGLMIGSQG